MRIAAITPCLRAALAALLLAAGGCYEATVDVGPAGITDTCTTISGSCDPFRRPPQGEVLYTLAAAQVKLTPMAASQSGATTSILAIDPEGAEFDIRVWATSEGTYRCEDPETAQRTRLDLTEASHGYYMTTVNLGRCEIAITHLPRPGDTLFEGTFSGRLLPYAPNPDGPADVVLTLGWFHVDVPPL